MAELCSNTKATAPGFSLLGLVLTCILVHSTSAPDAELHAANGGLPRAVSPDPPPREPPPSLLEAFTLNYTVPLEFYYVDDSNRGRGI